MDMGVAAVVGSALSVVVVVVVVVEASIKHASPVEVWVISPGIAFKDPNVTIVLASAISARIVLSLSDVHVIRVVLKDTFLVTVQELVGLKRLLDVIFVPSFLALHALFVFFNDILLDSL